LKTTYTNPDNDKRGPWTTSDLSANHIGPHFPITNPETGETYFPPKGRYWVFNEKEVEKRIKDGRIIFGKSGQARPVQKVYLKERKSLRVKPESWWDKHGLNEDGTKEMADLFSPKIFVHSKPSILVKNIVNISTKDEDIILDFFSGSGTTGHATIELNKEDGGKRKFICIQLQEETDEKSEAFKAGYKTIADLAKERIRRVIKKIENEQEAQKQAKAGKLDFGDEKEVPKLDLGFKVFKLQSSNFKIWRGNKFENGEQLEKQLDAFTDPVKEGSEEENMLYELLLKSGFDLNSRVANKGSYYVINGNEMAVVLTKMSEAIVNEIISLKPQKCIALDKLFAGNDQLKTNTVLQMRDAGVEFKTI